MPKFIYTAKNYNGQTQGGEVSAKDEKSLAQQLRADGFLVTSIREIKEENNSIEIKFLDRFNSVPLKEKMVFARNLSVMIASGLTVSRAINNLTAQTTNKTFKKVLTSVYEEMQAGKSLSESFAKFPGVFDELFVNMVRVGEIGGNLDEVLNIVAVQLEKEHDITSKVKGAMTYPAVILVVMFGIAILMLTVVLPKLMGVFKDMNVQLPAMTRAVIAVSDFLRNNIILSGIIVLCLVIFLKIFLARPQGKKTLSYLTTHVPIVKDIIIKVNCARFARIYSSLLRSGITVTDALKIISDTLTNYYYKQAFLTGIEDIQKGINLSTVLGQHPDIFPVMVMQIVQVGEETGKTETVLLQIAEFYEEEVNQMTKNMSSIIEPVLMVLIGGGVGFFAVAMLTPMYSLMGSIQ